MQNCPHNGCFTNITVKNDSFTVGDLDKANKKFEKMSILLTNNKDPSELIEGSLSFVAGGLRIIAFKDDGSYSFPACLH